MKNKFWMENLKAIIAGSVVGLIVLGLIYWKFFMQPPPPAYGPPPGGAGGKQHKHITDRHERDNSTTIWGLANQTYVQGLNLMPVNNTYATLTYKQKIVMMTMPISVNCENNPTPPHLQAMVGL